MEIKRQLVGGAIVLAYLAVGAVCAAAAYEVLHGTDSSDEGPAIEKVGGVLNSDTAQLLGNGKAKVAVIEFSDFQCPFCGRYEREIFPKLQRAYIETGRILYGFMNFPLESLHPLAFGASEAAECAAQEGRFWPMHARLFGDQRALQPGDLLQDASILHLDPQWFAACMKGSTSSKIDQEIAEGSRLGVTSTPSFFIGTVDDEHKVHLHTKITGAKSIETFRAVLEAALRMPPASKASQ